MKLFNKLLQKKLIISLILITSVLISANPNSYAASRDKLSLLSIQENEAVKDLIVIDSSIAGYKQKTLQIAKEITYLEKSSKILETHIKEKEIKVNQKKLVFNQRIRVMYKESKISFLEVLIKSKSISEIMNKLGLFKLIADNDSRLIKNILKEQKKLNKLKSNLDDKITNLKELKIENENAFTKLLLKEKSKKQFIKDLKSQKARVKTINNQVKAVRKKMISLGTSKSPKGRKIRVLATGYAANSAADGTNGQTSTGIPAARGVAAVSANPSSRIVPLGTKVYVPGYGKALIADVGGGVASNQIDLCFETRVEALRWGVKWVNITVYD